MDVSKGGRNAGGGKSPTKEAVFVEESIEVANPNRDEMQVFVRIRHPLQGSATAH